MADAPEAHRPVGRLAPNQGSDRQRSAWRVRRGISGPRKGEGEKTTAPGPLSLPSSSRCPVSTTAGRPRRDLLLITVPHARCPPSVQGHECDFVALASARLIAHYVGQRQRERANDAHARAPAPVLPPLDLKAVLVVPKPRDYRRVCDLNRASCRHTPYRQRLERALSTMRPRIRAVVDVHSFPHGDPMIEHDLGRGIEIAILNDTPPPPPAARAQALPPAPTARYSPYVRSGPLPPPPHYSLQLFQRLVAAGLRATVVEGDRLRAHIDIENQARREFGLPAVLVEFNEDLPSRYPARWAAAAAAVADWAIEDLDDGQGAMP